MKAAITMLTAVLLAALPFSARTQVGNPAPNFTVTDTHGNTHTLYDYLDSGKVVVLDFFYTTCGPCQFYSPQVNLAYEKYGCNTATVFFMSIDYNDTNAEVLAYDDQYQIEYPSVSGLNGGGNAVVGQYNITGFPTFYVIDSSRTIVQQIDPPTLQVFDYRFQQLGMQPAECALSAAQETGVARQPVLFPNPLVGNTLNVWLPEPVAGSGYFDILDITGRRVHSGRFGSGTAIQTVEIPAGDLPPGIYLIKFAATDNAQLYWGRFEIVQ